MQNSGILLVNKQKNKTSFSIVSMLRKITDIKKIGHAGTLDPFATGVMVMLIGKQYTKQSHILINSSKEYIAKIELGKKTDSYDVETPVIKISDKIPSLEEIEKTIESFQGHSMQIPPMYSAKKINGQKLYKLARKGETIKREPSSIFLEIKILKYEYPYLEINVKCSKGTYIRSLANDIGEKLGSFAFLKELIRTKVGNFDIKDCIDQEDLFEKDITKFIKK